MRRKGRRKKTSNRLSSSHASPCGVLCPNLLALPSGSRSKGSPRSRHCLHAHRKDPSKLSHSPLLCPLPGARHKAGTDASLQARRGFTTENVQTVGSENGHGGWCRTAFLVGLATGKSALKIDSGPIFHAEHAGNIKFDLHPAKPWYFLFFLKKSNFPAKNG